MYSGVVSICSIHLILLIAELNILTINQADVGNSYSYQEAYTKKRFISLLEENSLLSEWKVTCSLYLKPSMGYKQAENDP